MVLQESTNSVSTLADGGTPSLHGVSRQFLDALGVAVYTTDAEGIITDFNEAAAELWGCRPVLGKDAWCGSWRLYWPDGSPMAHADGLMGIALRENREVRGGEAIAERPDGTRVWFVPYPTPLRDAHGTLVGLVNVLVDVTERKLAEIRLTESEADLRDFFDNSPVALQWVGSDGTILRTNRAELDLLGYAESDYIGRPLTDFHVDKAATGDLLARLTRGEVVRDYESQVRCRDGSIKDVLVDSSVLWRDGQFIHTRCFTRDISERKRSEAALADALAAKDEFLSLVSHELRTPMTTIAGNAQVLQKNLAILDAETIVGALGDVVASSDRLNRIIDDLLVLARGDQGLELEVGPSRPERAVQLVADARELASGRKVAVTITPYDGYALADDSCLRQVIENLVSNADKYSPADAPVEVHISERDDQLFISVLDRGIGISDEDAKAVFDPFFRTEAAVSRAAGFGIGLAVCKRLADAMNGRIWAERRDGGGSAFTLALPKADTPDEADA